MVMERTMHFATERGSRQALIDRLGGDGRELAVVYWDKGHIDGSEYHIVTDNGIIIVENCRSGKVVTKKLARVAQLYQLEGKYDQRNHRVFAVRDLPASVIAKCRKYQALGYNNL